MKSLNISLIGLLGALAFTAIAQAAEPQATPASDTTASAQTDAKKPPMSDAYCLRHTGTRITSRDWGGYPILRFPQVPERIDVHIVPRPGQPFLGTGEVAQGPTPAMIANAVADATGARLRQLPLSRERVRKALEA